MTHLNLRGATSLTAGGRLRLTAVVLAAVVAVTSLSPFIAPHSTNAASPSLSGLRVQGNKLVNDAVQTVRLLGVNRSGTEYACIQGWGFHDGPADLASVQAIASWKANAIRVPLNETCWLGINGAPSAYSGANYQNEIARWVDTINQAGLVAILDLHWSAAGTAKATGLQPMPNRDHSPEFWRQVATRFKSKSMVVFDLYNEPYPDSNRNTTEAWRCWRDGGTCAGMSYQAAGMQELVNAVRNTGATNVIMAGGVQYAGGLWRWLEYKPNDPTGNLTASWHIYNFSWYTTESDWDQMLGPIAQQVPLTAGEIGDGESSPCTATFIDRVMNWSDDHGAGYLAWTWNRWNKCTDLITDWAGTPTSPFGTTYKDHLATQGGSTMPVATPTSTATPAATQTSTATPAATQSATVGAASDTYVSSAYPDTNYGTASGLASDANAVEQSYVRFDTGAFAGTVVAAKLRLYVTNGASAAGGTIRRMNSTTWSETGVTYNSRPAIDGVQVGNFDDVATGTWVEADVTSVVTGPGVYSFGVSQTGDDGADFVSRDNTTTTQRPQLVLTFGDTTNASPTPTMTATPTKTPAPITTPTATTPPASTETFTTGASADTYVSSAYPRSNYGTVGTLGSDASPTEESYLRFDTGAFAGTVASAKLRLYVTNGASAAGGTIRRMNSTTWSETGVTYRKRPTIDGAQVGSFDNVTTGTWVEVDVTSVVTGPGVYSFGVSQTGTDGVDFATRNNSNTGQRPQLVITTR
ncbi:MAG: GH5_40 / GH5 / GH5_5 [uncultured Chloroflexia bacterium]|uniref:cellulase n=1 Tax=uncultured Chloroflexia bacterium TaxID=1672391 RepID=A0A6J4JQV8_9CHLR|nr:MAG: GH5_40 / GH5 / GH5_5 [uncultured Chloroflexia bacterium]